VKNLLRDHLIYLGGIHGFHEQEINAYFDAQVEILQRQIDELNAARTYAIGNGAGFTVTDANDTVDPATGRVTDPTTNFIDTFSGSTTAAPVLGDMDQGVDVIYDSMIRHKHDLEQQFDNEQALVMAYMQRAVSEHKDVVDVFEAMNFSWLSDLTMTNDGTALTDANTNTWTEYDNTWDHFQYDVGQLADYAPDWQS